MEPSGLRSGGVKRSQALPNLLRRQSVGGLRLHGFAGGDEGRQAPADRLAAPMIRQDLPHGARRERKEMLAAQYAALELVEFQESFANERGGLQSMTPVLPSHEVGGGGAQMGKDETESGIASESITRLPR
jgi:hypothetical protein